jgi:adenylate cyclase
MSDGALERGVLRSDLLRTALLGGALVVMFAGNLIAAAISPDAMPPIVRAHLPAIGLLIGFAAAQQAAAYAYLRRAIRRDRPIAPALRYLNSLLEVSVVSVAIAVLGQDVDGLVLLNGPPTLVFFLLILLSTLHLDARVCVWTGAVAAIEYGALAAHYAGGAHALDPLLVNPMVHVGKAALIALAGLLAAFVAQQLRRRFTDALRVVAVFGQHVSPAVADRLLAERAHGAELRRVCVMFLDVRGFTAYASGRPPAEVMAHLNALFGPMIETVNRHHGIINKFLGDGFMAVFGAPLADERACAHAVAAALDLVGAHERAIEAGAIAPTQIGIGLHVGDAMTGDVGSTLRKEYTVIGDAVNLASRIEGLTKQAGARVLASAAVWRELDPPAGQSLGPMSVKGVSEPIEVYKLA